MARHGAYITYTKLNPCIKTVRTVVMIDGEELVFLDAGEAVLFDA